MHSAVARHDGAIGVQNCFRKELGWLLGPDPQAGLIDGVHQGDDIGLTKAAAEVPRRGGVGDSVGSQSVEIDLVVAPQFEVFDALTAGEDVEGDVQDVVGFVVGKMDLEQMKLGVDVADQAYPSSQQKHGADAAGAETLDAIGQFVVDIAGGHHGYGPLGTRWLPETLVNSSPSFLEDSLLACLAFFSESSTHSKASLSWNSEDVISPTLFQKHWGFSSFFSKNRELIKNRRLFRD